MASSNKITAFLIPPSITTRRLRQPMCCATTPPSTSSSTPVPASQASISTSSSSSIPVSLDTSETVSDTDDSPKFQVGQRVKVCVSIIMYHIPKHRNQPYDVKGLEGTIIKNISYEDGVQMSATAPYVVKFDNPRIQAHFSQDEIQLI